MEPPAKRMRIWQSVEVDEENAEYIKAKQKQQQKFKGRLESIFEKYGNMHESMSDEIDMATNRVVVDRGHLRRLKRQVGRKETMLLDTLGLAVGKESRNEGEEEDDEDSEDSEDELAPTQPVKSKETEPGLDGQQTSIPDAQSLRSDNIPSVPQHSNTPATSTPQFNTMQSPNTPNPNPTPNLLPLVQFPQTPAGQQAQATFYMTLTQGIGEVIQKAMAQSGLLPPNFSTPFASAAPPPTTPMITTDDKIAPATDPKWFFPPLSAVPRQDPVAQSSPLAAHVAAPAAGQADQPVVTSLPREHEGGLLAESTPMVEEATLSISHARLQESSPTAHRRTSPRVEIQRRRIRATRKYHFTPEDDAYISRRKMVDHSSWVAIKESQAKWKDWPASAISRRWALIKDQNLHLQTPVVACSINDVHDTETELVEQVEAPVMQSHHLPTPSSSEHEDGHMEATEPTQAFKGFPSSAYYDDDERELLSLAGSDAEGEEEEEREQEGEGEGEDHEIPCDEQMPDSLSEDSIIPSIETPTMIDEDDLQRDLLESLAMHDATITPPPQPSIQIKPEPTSPSTLTTQPEPALTRRSETIPDTPTANDDTNDSTPHQPPTTTTTTTAPPLTCQICNRTFKNPQTLTRHLSNPRNTHTHPAPPPLRKRSISIDLISSSITTTALKNNNDEDDDLLSPTTPRIKRESSTSDSPSFFVSVFQTPRVGEGKRRRRKSSGCGTSGMLSVERSERRAQVKQVKQWWKGTPVVSGKGGRRSLGGLVSGRKRGWVEESEEERDELCF
ncbi:hypothetical protein COCMIDRAFT_31852 [Bipolaris oryzae ATCC 44560]|uniref:C2H2-type domain-containing protein n=1 Tax=Bipolaris oryzae ATCC 44560 TaxID=930090 RepID=W6ZGK3_COCMI|nr:uncharacterized protein COCMIDRAFT_31852 [Bipolaris oryzae ATCC 44560]EUC50962.1 hypothetical protein COCMIDRAFT_31852 [Bipolaris oryzae ATCC 44560]